MVTHTFDELGKLIKENWQFGKEVRDMINTGMPQTAEPKRETAADGVAVIGAKTAGMAQEVREAVWNKLAPISRQLGVSKAEESKEMIQYPPYFTELRADFLSIQESLSSIMEALSLVEL